MNREDMFYRAILARDRRFDGKFFVGVKTTGIYCRPICPARPRRENVEFFRRAVDAEKSGYRPCLRCRPECAPLSPAWHGTSAVVSRALRIISRDPSQNTPEDVFAQKLGVTARHLRRLFAEEIGQTPRHLIEMQRLDFSRKLIVETSLPITEIAFSSGFSSLRRFNDAFKKRFHRAPRDIRKKHASIPLDKGIELTLSYRPPLDWRSLLDFYSSHQVSGVDQVSGMEYVRAFKIGSVNGCLKVSHDANKETIRLRIQATAADVLLSAAQRVRRMLDLDSDPAYVAGVFEKNSLLNKLWKKYPGLRMTGCWDPFETAVCTILGQLVSTAQARVLVGQLVAAYGETISTDELHPSRAFPTADVLAQASLDTVRTTSMRKRSIRELAKRVVDRQLDLFTPQDPAEIKAQLMDIPGIGPWSAEYIALRALGDTDAFPKTDLILKRALKKHGLDLDNIRPWRAYAAIYLWKEFAKQKEVA